jgi:hypothetical protein
MGIRIQSIKRTLVTVLLVALSLGTLGFSPPQQQQDIEIDVAAGFGGYYRADKWTPVQVTVRNNGTRDIQGTVQIRTRATDDGREQLFTSPFFVRFGSERSEYIHVSFEAQTREFSIELLDNEGRVLETQVAQITPVRQRDILYGVISEASEQIQLTGLRIGAGAGYQVNWRPEDLPASADALRSLDVITIFGVANARLSEGQQQALQDWVTGGGHLIVHGGAGTSWQFAREYLDELLPTELLGNETVQDLSALGRLVGRPSDILAPDDSAGYIVTENVPRSNANVLLEVENIPVVVREKVGSGVVDFVALDPISNPLDEYEHTEALWQELVTSRPQRATWAYDFEDWEAADNAVRIVTGFELPSALQMLGFLIVYIALIGPINFVVLRAIGRREFAWFTIPIVIGIFTVIAYFTGFSLRGDAATVNHLAVVQAYPENDRARVDGLVGVFSPRRTTYNVSVDEGMTLRTIPELEDIDTGIAEIPIVEEGEFRVEELPVDAGIIATFASSGYRVAPDYEGLATWVLSGGNAVNVEGFIQLDDIVLQDAVVLAHRGFVPLGDLQPGERYEFTFDQQQYPIILGDMIPLSLGNRTTIGRFVGRGTGTFVGPRVNTTLCGDFNLTLGQIMNDVAFDCLGGGGEDEERINRRRALMIQAITDTHQQDTGRSSDIYVAGWVETAPFETTLGTNQENRYESLYILKLPVNYRTEAARNPVVPTGLMTWTLVDTDGFNLDRTPRGQTLNVNDLITFRFAPAEAFATAPVETIALEVDVNGSNEQLQLSVWNWATGQWEVFEIPPDSMVNIEDTDDYLGLNNSFKVLLQTGENFNTADLAAINPVLILQ